MTTNFTLGELKVKRAGFIRQITEFEKYLKQINNAEISTSLSINLSNRINRLQNKYDVFDSLQTSIELLTDSLDNELDAREEITQRYDQVIAIAQPLIDSFNIKVKTEQDKTNVYSNVKLPTLDLPTFDGNVTEWHAFEDSFNALIDNNNMLNDVQKLCYLKSALKGEALAAIKDLNTTAVNYKIAFEIVKNRFSNNRKIIYSHVNAILNARGASLKSLINSIDQNIRCLNSLNIPVDKWDAILVPIILSKLDSKLVREWELHINSTIEKHILPCYRKLICYLLERSDAYSLTSIKNTIFNPNIKQPKIITAIAKTKYQAFSCSVCKQNHSIYSCKEFSNKSVSDRIKFIQNSKMCMNCLKIGHFVRECVSTSRCKHCSSTHHTLLHLQENEMKKSSSMESISVNCCTDTPCFKETLLPTVEIIIFDNKGRGHNARALLDSASQSNFIQESFARKIGLKLNNLNLNISGINRGLTTVKHCTNFLIGSKFNNFQTSIQALLLKQITDKLPQSSFDKSMLNLPNEVVTEIADQSFNISGNIDVLIGASTFWKLVESEQIIIKNKGIIAQRTKLGWIVSGQIPLKQNCNNKTLTLCQVEKLWILDDFKINAVPISKTHQFCEDLFNASTTRDNSGHFIVTIPFKENLHELGDTKNVAINRFFALERRLEKDLQTKNIYIEFMRDYQNLGHMTISENKKFNDDIEYFLPHHHVIREESTTTKLRVVFDGSFKSSSGVALNDVQHTGPALQTDLFSVLIAFRQFAYVATADIQKMYRQILIHPSQRSLQKIVWRESPNDKLEFFTLNTVTYGTASAPYLAIRCIHEIAKECAKEFPIESDLIKNNIYVDDLLIGANDVNTLEKYCLNIANLLKKSGFHLHKWSSNTSLLSIFLEKQNNYVELNRHETKTLGISYNPLTDVFNYTFKKIATDNNPTKRKIVSITSQIFDPLGLLAPLIIVPKIIIQDIWKLKLDWDRKIPDIINREWTNFIENLHLIDKLSIPRKIINNSHNRLELHGFADASVKAYGACLYLKSIDRNNKCQIHLITAKSRVAPLKQVTLARLELCAALLLAELSHHICNILKFKIDKKYYWSDSTIVLAWIRNPSSKWKVFVANRTSEIQTLTDMSQWHHVKSKDNPADLISRGCKPQDLQNSSLWWNGPSWLSENNINLEETYAIETEDIPEQKLVISLHVSTTTSFDIVSKFSKLNTLINVFAYVRRFIHNCKNKTNKITSGLTIKERKTSLNMLIKEAQLQEFKTEMHELVNGNNLRSKSKLLNLSPFLDNEGLLRVGGRLKNSNYNYNKKHQILLPHSHPLTNLILIHYHIIHLHCGPLYLLNCIRNMYWPIAGKSLCKKIVHQCVKCYRTKPQAYNSFMGDLPQNRIIPAPPFYHTGLDYAGPIYTRDRRARGYKKFKSYICLFICFTTKAVHIELVSDLTSEAFLASLRRFVSRRGTPKSLHSDNGTNFTAADKHLKELYTLIKNESSNLVRKLSNEGSEIEWHFIPPRAPHFGGLWESNIKLIKSHLSRVLGENIYTFEELNTVLNQIEAVLNSRPLSPLSDDPTDLNPLTPAHFLIGRPLTALPDDDVIGIPESRLAAFQRMQQIVQNFWKRWKQEYLHTLQTRNKWKASHPMQLKENMLVLLKEDNEPPMTWKMGRITEVHPGKDSVIRVVSLRTQNNILKRSVNRICMLPIMDNL